MIKRKRLEDPSENQITETLASSADDNIQKPQKIPKHQYNSDVSSSPAAKMFPSQPGQSGQQVAAPQGQVQNTSVEDTRQKYIQIQQTLRAEIQQYGQNHPRGIEAMKKLEQFNQHMLRLKNQHATQRAAAAGVNPQAQPAQGHVQPSAQVPNTVQQSKAQIVNPAGAVGAVVNRPSVVANPPSAAAAVAPSTGGGGGGGGGGAPMKLLVPRHIDAENADNWRREAETRLRTAYASMVQFRNQMQGIQTILGNPQNGLSNEEILEKRGQLDQIQKQNKKCEDFINAFRLQQSTLAASIKNAAEQNSSSGGPSADAVNAGPVGVAAPGNSINKANTNNPPQVAAPTAVPNQTKIPPNPIPKAPTLQRKPSNIGSVDNALAAVSAQNAANSNGSAKSPTASTPVIALKSQGAGATFTTPAQPSNQNITQESATSPIRGNTRPITGVSSASVSQVQAGTPQTAVLESPSKSTSSMAIPSAQTAPNFQREGVPSHKLHIPKTLSMPAPAAVPVPPHRPTLTGGTHAASGSQVVASPAISKQPVFELDDNGGGLLSKRKLQELVKQIDPEESLDPEVEESILELTEEFVDTLLAYSCRMAKHRGGDTLDIRDVQMVLERNWNMRIPGYSMDDIRTVRKFNPTAAYQQKLQALQAGKALNQSEGTSKAD